VIQKLTRVAADLQDVRRCDASVTLDLRSHVGKNLAFNVVDRLSTEHVIGSVVAVEIRLGEGVGGPEMAAQAADRVFVGAILVEDPQPESTTNGAEPDFV
jgi:hypothetical protein